MSDEPRPNYEAKVIAAALAHGIGPGDVLNVEVLHDDWCGIFKGRPCDCDPDTRIVTRESKL